MALRYPGIRMLLVRRTYQELENNHIRFLRRELAGIAGYRATARQFVFANGSVLDFGYCACDGDLDRYQGAEYDVVFLDEATQLREEWMRQFAACVRGVNDFPKRIYYTCNPGGPGHGYIKRLFIDKRYLPGENPKDYEFIPARVTDNRALLKKQPEYLQQLQTLPDKLRAAWLESGTSFRGSFSRSLPTTRSIIATGGLPMLSNRLTSPENGRSIEAMISATQSPSPAAGGRWILTDVFTGF